MKHANVLATGTFPLFASPAAQSTSEGSAIPTLKKRSGNASSNR
jgi:hypothetical protein